HDWRSEFATESARAFAISQVTDDGQITAFGRGPGGSRAKAARPSGKDYCLHTIVITASQAPTLHTAGRSSFRPAAPSRRETLSTTFPRKVAVHPAVGFQAAGYRRRHKFAIPRQKAEPLKPRRRAPIGRLPC